MDETKLAALDLHDDIKELAATQYNPFVLPVLVFPDMEPDRAIKQLAKRAGVYVIWGVHDLLADLEEIVRSVAMTSILDKLGVDTFDEEELPSVVVFIISGGALAMHSDKLVNSLRELLRTYPGGSEITHWEGVISRLVAEENRVLQELSYQELTEALRDDSPDYFTLWENRN